MSGGSGNPEVARSARTGQVTTNYHDVGQGAPVLLLHGSGPGVSAWVNWRFLLGEMAGDFRLIAPDLAGFGYTEIPEDVVFQQSLWLDQLIALLDTLGLERVHIIGNSFGGALALALAIHHPDRVGRMVLMGSAGVPVRLTPGLDIAWGYQPSVENMREILLLFAHNKALISDDLVRVRYEASLRPGVMESYSRMFPAPRQRWLDALAQSEADIRALRHPTLVVHGRDDQIIPLDAAMTLLDWIPDCELHVFGQCGHWTQIERARDFHKLVSVFLAKADEGGS